jgi:tetratricopeptide (TPR) repeat protein
MSVNKFFTGVWLVIGLVALLYLMQPVWRMNKANIIAARILLSDTQFTADNVKALGTGVNGTPKNLTTKVLALISLTGAQSMEYARILLQQTLEIGTLDEQLSTGLRLEKQAETWATSGFKEQAQTIFKLLTMFQLPSAEPYFRMGEFYYLNHFDLGFPYEQAYQAAIRAPVITLRDNDLKSLAYSRLCENVLANSQDYELAEKLCSRAIDLAGQGPLFGHYAIKAHIMLGQALAGQGRFTEAADLLKSLIQGPPDRPYEAFAMYYLGYYVWEAQSRWKEALESYQQLILNADKDSRDSAKERVRLLCSEHPEWNCALP